MRAIDGETLWAYLISEGQTKASKYGFRLGDTIKFTPSEIDEIVKKMPTIEPRRKGKWLHDNTTYEKLWYFVCSECKQATKIPHYMGGFLYNFCPNCGADMRGESNDEC